MPLNVIHLREHILSFRERWNEQYPRANYRSFDGTTNREWRKVFDQIDWQACSIYFYEYRRAHDKIAYLATLPWIGKITC